jgi:alanyl-tRNA synthetase
MNTHEDQNVWHNNQMTEQLYFDEPLTLEFTAQVTESRPLDGGRFGVVLPRTYFYPTSGGQEHDTGSIGDAYVIDVYKEDGTIVHVLDRELAPGTYPARIDRERRFRHMQHHTAQHILSASFLEVADIDSISANINGETPSTIDLEVDEVDPETLRQAEEFANGIFFENRAVKIYHVTQDEIKKLPVRKPPKVSGSIRVVEVDGFDFTPCGGTHCPNTGMVGLLKIVKTERVNQRVRVHFVAGYQALEYFQQVQSAAQGAALLLDSGLDAVVTSVERMQTHLKVTQNELDSLRGVVLGVEAEKLVAAAEAVGELRLATALFENRPASELRSLADRLRQNTGMVAVLASYDGSKLSMVATRADGVDVDARELLNNHLIPIGGRGGGSPTLAQGGGAVNQSALEVLFKQTKNYLNVS